MASLHEAGAKEIKEMKARLADLGLRAEDYNQRLAYDGVNFTWEHVGDLMAINSLLARACQEGRS